MRSHTNLSVEMTLPAHLQRLHICCTLRQLNGQGMQGKNHHLPVTRCIGEMDKHKVTQRYHSSSMKDTAR